jgi:hypothetical protein
MRKNQFDYPDVSESHGEPITVVIAEDNEDALAYELGANALFRQTNDVPELERYSAQHV